MTGTSATRKNFFNQVVDVSNIPIRSYCAPEEPVSVKNLKWHSSSWKTFGERW